MQIQPRKYSICIRLAGSTSIETLQICGKKCKNANLKYKIIFQHIKYDLLQMMKPKYYIKRGKNFFHVVEKKMFYMLQQQVPKSNTCHKTHITFLHIQTKPGPKICQFTTCFNWARKKEFIDIFFSSFW